MCHRAIGDCGAYHRSLSKQCSMSMGLQVHAQTVWRCLQTCASLAYFCYDILF